MKRQYSIIQISGLLIVFALLLSAFAYQPAPAFTVSLATPTRTGPTDPDELGAFIDELMASEMETNQFPGAVVVVVKDGQLFFQKGYGYADLENQTPVDAEHTLFRIGSITKLFTWTAVMQLAEQGKLDLEEDINTYLDFEIPNTYPDPITLKNLMSHTAGFEEQNDGHFKTRAEDMLSLDQYLKTHIPARVFPPGKVVAYSNYGGALAGYIVERVSGMPFTEYVEKNIFTPLGMTRSTLRQPLPPGLASDLSSGYYKEQGQYVKVGFEYVVDYPAGSLSSTATDMAQFLLANLQNGKLGGNRIMSEQTAKQMHSQLFTHDTRIPGMAYGFFESSLNGHRILSHGGDTHFFHSGLWLVPDQNTGIFVATNGAGGAITVAMLIQNYMDHYYPFAPKPVPEPSVGFANRVAPYLGTYCSVHRNFTTFEKLMGGIPPYNLSLDAKDNLILTVQGVQIPLVEVEPGLLRYSGDVDIQFVLQTDDAGQAYLLSSDSSDYMKISWYGTIGFRDLLIQLGLLSFLGSLIVWGIAALVGLHKGKPRSLLSRLARWVGALFGLVLIVLFLGLISMLETRDPVFDYPVILLGKTPLFYILMALPYLLAWLGLLMLVFTLLAWIHRYWGWGGRLHYTLLTISGLSVLWVLWYWNLLF